MGTFLREAHADAHYRVIVPTLPGHPGAGRSARRRAEAARHRHRTRSRKLARWVACRRTRSPRLRAFDHSAVTCWRLEERRCAPNADPPTADGLSAYPDCLRARLALHGHWRSSQSAFSRYDGTRRSRPAQRVSRHLESLHGLQDDAEAVRQHASGGRRSTLLGHFGSGVRRLVRERSRASVRRTRSLVSRTYAQRSSGNRSASGSRPDVRRPSVNGISDSMMF